MTLGDSKVEGELRVGEVEDLEVRLEIVDDGVHYPCFRDLPGLKALGSGASISSHDL